MSTHCIEIVSYRQEQTVRWLMRDDGDNEIVPVLDKVTTFLSLRFPHEDTPLEVIISEDALNKYVIPLFTKEEKSPE